MDHSWNKEETKYLWDLCEQYDLRFYIIHDRYDDKYERTIEDLKHRYYSVAKRIVEINLGKSHPLAKFNYNPEYEKMRKF